MRRAVQPVRVGDKILGEGQPIWIQSMLSVPSDDVEGNVRQALELEVAEEKEAGDGSFKLVYLGDGETGFRLELTWLRDRTEPYDLGEQEFHLAFRTDRYDALYARHKAMGCVCLENPAMGVYFIEDPDGYWIEIVPARE